jgi:hypothetical protein
MRIVTKLVGQLSMIIYGKIMGFQSKRPTKPILFSSFGWMIFASKARYEKRRTSRRDGSTIERASLFRAEQKSLLFGSGHSGSAFLLLAKATEGARSQSYAGRAGRVSPDQGEEGNGTGGSASGRSLDRASD